MEDRSLKETVMHCIERKRPWDEDLQLSGLAWHQRSVKLPAIQANPHVFVTSEARPSNNRVRRGSKYSTVKRMTSVEHHHRPYLRQETSNGFVSASALGSDKSPVRWSCPAQTLNTNPTRQDRRQSPDLARAIKEYPNTALRSATHGTESEVAIRRDCQRRSAELPSMRSNLEQDYPREQPLPISDVLDVAHASNRLLPSPPSRSFSSPKSIKLPSPSPSMTGPSAGGSFALPANASKSLPSISNMHDLTPPCDHSAALPHEAKAQRIALTSLQSEHNKLLLAFSRSEVRTRALEKEHADAQNEIINLSEDRSRLQSQVIELEREIEDVSRSRDEYRQVAVQEGSQYMEIIKKASQLEQMAANERKAWSILKEEMMQKIESQGRSPSIEIRPAPREPAVQTPPSSCDSVPGIKVEFVGDMQERTSTWDPISAQHRAIQELQEENHRLQERCAMVENTLRSVHHDGQSIGIIIRALLDKTESTLAG